MDDNGALLKLHIHDFVEHGRLTIKEGRGIGNCYVIPIDGL